MLMNVYEAKLKTFYLDFVHFVEARNSRSELVTHIESIKCHTTRRDLRPSKPVVSKIACQQLLQLSRSYKKVFQKLQESLNKKIDDFTTDVYSKLSNSQIYIDQQVGLLVSRIEVVEKKVEHVRKEEGPNSTNPLECVERCVVVSGLPYQEDEDLKYKLLSLLEAMSIEGEVLGFKRLGGGPVPLVKWLYIQMRVQRFWQINKS
jgi:hypothetical protein